MMIFTSWQSRLFVMEIVTLQLNHNVSNLFPLKWLRMTQNGQFHLIYNFSNLFPLKFLRMTQNGQFSMAQIKYTLIQGNFYERLPFYMDSCALSLTASLLNSAGILGQHDILVLAEVPPPCWKIWILSKLQLFQSFPTKVAQNDSEWPISPNSQLFQSFATKVAQNNSEQPILHGQNKIHSDVWENSMKDYPSTWTALL